MEMVSAATVVGVRVFVGEGIAVGVRVAVGGSVSVGVAEGPAAVGGSVEVGVKDGPMAVGVRVDVGSGGASRLISIERAPDQVPFTCPAVRARTRHQKRRSLVKVCVVWVWVSPVCAAKSGLVIELESSNWISYVAAPGTALHAKGMLWLIGSRALFAGLSSVGAGSGV